MLRNTFFAVLTILAVAASSQAAVITFMSTPEDTPGLAGFQTWTVRAQSDQPMQGFDFAGDGGNDPATGSGFFGAMNQINPFGQATVYSDSNPIIEGTGGDPKQDSQFTVRTQDVVVPAGFAEEGPMILQGIWAHSAPVGDAFDICQIVMPLGGRVDFRGLITTLEGASIVENAVMGVVGGGTTVDPPVAVDLDLGERIQGAVISHLFTTSAGTEPITWSDLQIVGPAPATLPTLTSDGNFSWISHDSPFGIYTFNATASNASPTTDVGSLTVELIIPEPATMTLFGLAMIGLVGFARRRS